jgi:hypothetical protein
MKKLLTILAILFCLNASAQTVTLTGSGTDADGTVVGYSWRKVSGPASGVITNSNSAITTVTGLTVGIYLYELTVTDNQGATGVDTVQITVLAGNIRPKANAGVDQIITLPVTGALLKGIGADADGYIIAYNWSRVSGPKFPRCNHSLIVNRDSVSTLVTGLKAGSYVFGLTVTDNQCATNTDYVNVTVKKRNRSF